MTASTKSPVTIRKGIESDAQAISKLGKYVFSLSFGHSVQPHQLQTYLDEAYSVDAIQKDLLDPAKTTVVVVDDDQGQVVGFVLLTRGTTEPCLTHIGKHVELQRIYVHPEMHGLGVGKSLALEVERIARDEGFEHIWLGVWEDNLKAQKVYRKLGFEVIGDHVFDFGGDLQTDLIMIKRLSAA